DLAAVVRGIGNRRGEVARDPLSPVESARLAGARLQDLRCTDYRIDTERSMTVWPGR
ncbi:MAG: flavodoxin family protein, partial [Betaproteobacteria bacterium]|nr:flavodoxin family protein [Betaproteobacteria bacterium]